MKRLIYFICSLSIILAGCSKSQKVNLTSSKNLIDSVLVPDLPKPRALPDTLTIAHDIYLKKYFEYVQNIINQYPHLKKNPLGEYILIHRNPWIIDTLRNLDYYRQKKKNRFIYDLNEELVIPKKAKLVIPTRLETDSIGEELTNLIIDVNVPEYRLRILQDNDTVLNCLVRVGRNAEEYQEALQQKVDLKTPIGEGSVVAIHKKPIYYDVHTGLRYEKTRRDDGLTTVMPEIPTIEPEINGRRSGTLIHATTNLNTLGKAYSHGCIGVSEADAWSVYYYAPPGTKVKFRYNLKVILTNDTLHLKDIYQLHSSTKIKNPQDE